MDSRADLALPAPRHAAAVPPPMDPMDPTTISLRPSFAWGWLILTAAMVFVFTNTATLVLAAVGLTDDLWLIALASLPVVAAGFIVGYAAQERRYVETMLGLAVARIAPCLWVYLQTLTDPYASGFGSGYWSALFLQLAIGAGLVVAGAALGRAAQRG